MLDIPDTLWKRRGSIIRLSFLLGGFAITIYAGGWGFFVEPINALIWLAASLLPLSIYLVALRTRVGSLIIGGCLLVALWRYLSYLLGSESSTAALAIFIYLPLSLAIVGVGWGAESFVQKMYGHNGSSPERGI